MSIPSNDFLASLPLPRLEPYQQRVQGGTYESWALHNWNSNLASAFQESLSFVELVLRNSLDEQLKVWNEGENGYSEWSKHPASPLNNIIDRKTVNQFKNSADLARRRRASSHPRKNAPITHDDRISTATFGLWMTLFPKGDDISKANEEDSRIQAAQSSGDSYAENKAKSKKSVLLSKKPLWEQSLILAFPHLKNDPHGHGVGDRVRRLHALRNRVSHMENLLDVDVDARLRDALQLVNAINPEYMDWLKKASRVDSVNSLRPSQ